MLPSQPELPEEAQLVVHYLDKPDGSIASEESGGQAQPASVLGPCCELWFLGHHSPQEAGTPPHFEVVKLAQTRASVVRPLGWGFSGSPHSGPAALGLCPEGRKSSRTLRIMRGIPGARGKWLKARIGGESGTSGKI